MKWRDHPSTEGEHFQESKSLRRHTELPGVQNSTKNWKSCYNCYRIWAKFSKLEDFGPEI